MEPKTTGSGWAAVVLAIAGCCCFPWTATAQSPTESISYPLLVARDSNGKLVGPVVGMTWADDTSALPGGALELAQVGALFRWQGEKIVLAVREDSLNTGVEVRYELPNCQGTAKMRGPDVRLQALLGAIYGIGDGDVLYRASTDAGNACSDNTYQSWARDGLGCVNGSGTVSFCKVATSVVDLDTLFTPPFHLE